MENSVLYFRTHIKLMRLLTFTFLFSSAMASYSLFIRFTCVPNATPLFLGNYHLIRFQNKIYSFINLFVSFFFFFSFWFPYDFDSSTRFMERELLHFFFQIYKKKSNNLHSLQTNAEICTHTRHKQTKN